MFTSMYYYVRQTTLQEKGVIAAIQEDHDGPMTELPPHQDGWAIVEVKTDGPEVKAVVLPTEMASLLQTDYIDLSPDCMGGKPRLEGHRITVGQLIAELLDEAPVQVAAVAENYDLDPRRLTRMYEDVAHFFDQPWGRNCAKLEVPPQDHSLLVESFIVENRTFTLDSPQEVRIWTYHGSPKQIVAEFRSGSLMELARGCGKDEVEALARLFRDVAKIYDRHPQDAKGITATSID